MLLLNADLPHYTPKNIFFAGLINKTMEIPNFIFYVLFFLNAALVWLISKEIFEKKYRFIPLIIYFLSFWGYYMAFSYSFYFYLLFATLLTIYGFILTVKNKKMGLPVFSLGYGMSIYSSSILFFVFPLILVTLAILKVIPKIKFRRLGILGIAITLPLLLIILTNIFGFKNDIKSDIKFFSDPGLINMVNRYQGAATQDGYRNLSRISENKYLFSTEYIFLKYLSQFAPMNFFSPQHKLLNFSFSPPMLLGFIIPFFVGSYLLVTKPLSRKIIFALTLLVIPSVLAKDLVALNRLILFMPVMLYITTYGLIHFIKNKRKSILFIIFGLIIFQLAVSLIDIQTKESLRAQKYLEGKYEITEQ